MRKYAVVLTLILISICIYILTNLLSPTENVYFNYRKRTLENAKITLYPQPKKSKVSKRYYKAIQNNTHDYRRLINQPNLCSNHREVFLLIAIRTIYSHFDRREILRDQYKHTLYINYELNMIIKVIFLFGKTNDSLTEKLINEESRKYNDIIQEDFVESYVNVSLKAIMAWKWALEFCPNTNYVMVENDEAYVDLDKLVVFLLKDLSMNRTDDHFAVCFALGNGRSDHLTRKKFSSLPKEQVYQGNFTPRYCHGVVYAAHIDVINKLYKASLKNIPFMPTDIWIGVMAEKLRLSIQRLNHLYLKPDAKHFFSDVNYPIKEPMIVITDWDKNEGGKEVIHMRNIHSKIKKYWGRIEHKRNHIISPYEFVEIYVFNIYIAIGLTITLTLFLRGRILLQFIYNVLSLHLKK